MSPSLDKTELAGRVCERVRTAMAGGRLVLPNPKLLGGLAKRVRETRKNGRGRGCRRLSRHKTRREARGRSPFPLYLVTAH